MKDGEVKPSQEEKSEQGNPHPEIAHHLNRRPYVESLKLEITQRFVAAISICQHKD